MIIRRVQDIGALIRSTRHAQKMTQKALAERVGVSRIWISQIERGKASAEIGRVLKVLSELGVHLTVGEWQDDGLKKTNGATVKRPLIDINEIADGAL